LLYNQLDLFIGYLCFQLCLDPSQHLSLKFAHRCRRCPATPITLKSPAALVEHIGSHVLFDNLGASPCGFCLGYDCRIYLCRQPGRDSAALRIDRSRSKCPSLAQLSLGAAKKTGKVRCSNAPLACPECPADSEAQWKYNLHIHLRDVHGLDGEALKKHRNLYSISKEESSMMKSNHNKMLNTRMTVNKLTLLANYSISVEHQINPVAK